MPATARGERRSRSAVVLQLKRIRITHDLDAVASPLAGPGAAIGLASRLGDRGLRRAARPQPPPPRLNGKLTFARSESQ